jgi:hypothetical protein
VESDVCGIVAEIIKLSPLRIVPPFAFILFLFYKKVEKLEDVGMEIC